MHECALVSVCASVRACANTSACVNLIAGKACMRMCLFTFVLALVYACAYSYNSECICVDVCACVCTVGITQVKNTNIALKSTILKNFLPMEVTSDLLLFI